MRRTTVAIDPLLLEELREISDRENKPLRKVIGEVLAAGLRERKSRTQKNVLKLKWQSQPMGAKIDYLDKEEVYGVLDQGK